MVSASVRENGIDVKCRRECIPIVEEEDGTPVVLVSNNPTYSLVDGSGGALIVPTTAIQAADRASRLRN